jgi:hypothetical protein
MVKERVVIQDPFLDEQPQGIPYPPIPGLGKMRMLLANLDGAPEQCVFEGRYGFVTFDDGVESAVFFEQPGIHCLSRENGDRR